MNPTALFTMAVLGLGWLGVGIAALLLADWYGFALYVVASIAFYIRW